MTAKDNITKFDYFTDIVLKINMSVVISKANPIKKISSGDS
jgi:hypothetical protein